MRKKELSKEILDQMVQFYTETFSVLKTAKKFNVGINRTRRELKKAGILKSLSDFAKMRTGDKNPFFGKQHSESVKKKHSEFMQTRVGNLNANFKHGRYLRRPRDFRLVEFKPIRNRIYNRDKYTCQISGITGGHLHAHHLLPYWVCPEAFLDEDNLITVSSKIHLEICHNGNWAKFNPDLVPDKLLEKYSINRERLNELASMYN